MGSTLRSTIPPRSSDVSFISELAQTAAIRESLPWFGRERQWINEQHVQLCRIPAPTFLEGRRAEWMVTQLRSLGWDARIDRGGNVVAWT
jgi:hypothetical protein